MKKGIHLLLAALFFAAPLLPAQTLLLPLLLDSTHYHYYDPFSGQEQFKVFSYRFYNAENLESTAYFHNYFGADPTYFRYDYEYNPAGQITKSTSVRSLVSPITGPWENWLKDEYEYDAQERNTYFIGQLGDSNGWFNYYQQHTWFNDVTPADSSLYELWDDLAASWNNNRRTFNYYNPNGDLKLYKQDEWDGDIEEWNRLDHIDYAYYPDGKLRSQRYIRFTENNVLSINTDSFLYRLDGKIDSTFSSNQTTIPGDPVYFITKSTYDNDGNLIENLVVTKSVSSPTWKFSSKQQFAPGDGYYSNDFSLERQAIYNQSNQSFEVSWEITRHYTDLGNGGVFFQEEQKHRNNQGMLATQYIDSLWYRNSTVGLNSLPDPGAACQFANPFRPGNSIICDAPDQHSAMQIRITNISGQVVAQGKVLPGEAWRPAADWPGGLYFLTAWQNGRYLGERKLVVAK